MAETTGDAGGGGTVNSLCMISPSDEVGIVGNLISRIEELEKVVSQLMSANVTAGQLSDLSQQVGWVYDVTFMGVPGWTQTEAGTLIPPAGFSLSNIGFTLSDGNTYQGVSFDSDGVLQLGFTASGNVSGSMIGTDFFNITNFDIDPVFSYGIDFATAIGKEERGSSITISGSDSHHIHINSKGVYLLTWSIEVIVDDAVTENIGLYANSDFLYPVANGYVISRADCRPARATADGEPPVLSGACLLYASGNFPNRLTISLGDFPGTDDPFLSDCYLGIVKLQG